MRVGTGPARFSPLHALWCRHLILLDLDTSLSGSILRLSLKFCAAFCFSKAACLRAVRLGGTSADEAAEVDMRLAAIAERYGHPSAAVHMYSHMMANPATNDHGR